MELKKSSIRKYKVPLYDDSRKSIQTIQAVGISQISEDSVGVDISRISRILEMPASKLHRKEGPIDLLIGINYPRFHIGETKVKDGLVARRSPLAWVIFGSNSDDTPKSQTSPLRPSLQTCQTHGILDN